MVAASEGKGSRLISWTMLQGERGVGEREREKLNRILGKRKKKSRAATENTSWSCTKIGSRACGAVASLTSQHK